MAQPLRVTVGNSNALVLKIDAEPVRQVIAGMPKVAYFWLRDFMFLAFKTHRSTWLATKSTKFGRGGANSRGIKVPMINEAVADASGAVVYRVRPEARRMPNTAAAVRGLDELTAEAFTSSDILPSHEFGETQRARRKRFLAVPVKTRPGNPRAWRAANPGKTLVTMPSKRGDGSMLLYEQQIVRARGRTKKGEAPKTRERWRLRFVLRQTITLRPTLHLFDSWEQLTADRDRLWAAAASKMLRDLERADPRDL